MSMSPKPGAVLFAKDMHRIARFYEKVLGLAVAHVGSDIVVLESAQSQLIVHAIPERIAASITISEPPRIREASSLKLVFPVASIDHARDEASAAGGGLKPKSREFEARGFRACDGHDPEGNVFQVRIAASS